MAATVYMPPSPHDRVSMSTNRRTPLSSIPNATNSPHRTLGSHGATKRSRQQIFISQENEPPQKKQMLERDTQENPITPRRKAPPPSTAEGRVFERNSNNTQPTAFQKKLAAARGGSIRVTKGERGQNDTSESVRQWQKHYRKLFPSFVFFFESIPEDLRAKCSKQITGLGAREEKFFSRTVTHVVTTRPLPPEVGPAVTSESSAQPSIASPELHPDSQPHTINPSLLDKTTNLDAVQNSTRNLSEADGSRKSQQALGARRDLNSSTDVLSRARQMGMKIWQLEKLQRMIGAIYEGEGSIHSHNTRGNIATLPRAKAEDLSQVLRNEKLNGPSDRDPTAVSKETVPFRGPFIYIHDMEEKYKPTMVREYPKVSKRQDGAWPQFRSAPIGKCPFLDEATTRKDWQREHDREKAMALQKEKETKLQQDETPKTITIETQEPTLMEPPRRRSPRKALREVGQAISQPSVERNRSAGPGKFVSEEQPPQKQFSPELENNSNWEFIRPPTMHFANEPAASGIRQSNITSAIQSQMISSTAATPGVKAGTSKEVHELKRKVLERNTGSLSGGSMSVGSIPTSHRMTDIAGALRSARAPAPQRAAKSKAQEKLGGVPEEATLSEEELAMERMAHIPKKALKKAAKKDPKPGYCENCRDKFDDFEEHTISRKHRKFAQTQSNWAELDALLRILQNPALENRATEPRTSAVC